MLKRLNRLLALAAALMAGSGAHAQTPDVVPNKTAQPVASPDKAAIIDRATRKAQLNQARAAAAARNMAAVKARGKVDPALLGTNPAVKVANDRNAAQAALVGSKSAAGGAQASIVVLPGTGVPGPGFQLKQPDYMFNTAANWMYTKPIHKFVDSLAGLTSAHKNNLGNFIPVAKPMAYPADPNADYYEIGVHDYTMQMHSELLPTKFRGYHDLNPAAENTANGANSSNYLGPVILAHRDRPVRVKMVNQLPTGPVNPLTGRRPGDLFLPVDTTMEGAGVGPLGGSELYTQNRAEFHLHGGLSPWISDGTPHQWNTPAGEVTNYKKGVSNRNVPDMGAGAPGDGITTYYWTNQQSGRLMFYHDHAFGMTRLNVYAGEAAGYLIIDPVEDQLIAAGVLPDNADLDANGVYKYGVPLILQDKTFVNTTFLGPVGDPLLDTTVNPPVPQATDPTWDVNAYGGQDQLWFPHVYMVNQSPHDPSGANNFGRWDYGPWFWPPLNAAAGLVHGEEPILGDPLGTTYPGTPNPSGVQEAFMDTPVINGTAYPVMQVQPKSYRFRILNAANDRFWNLSMFQADPNGYLDANGKPTEVRMVASAPGNPAFPSANDPYGETQNWPTDGRDGGVPDPTMQGPSLYQIGNESGFMPWPHEHKPQPIGYNYNRRDIVVLNVQERSLFLGPAMRADVIVDFSKFPGQRIILYNDSPAPVPAFDARVDYYTGDPDQRDSGGANTTQPGFGPNTRTIMAFDVAASAPAAAFDTTKVEAAWTSTPTAPGAYAATQHPPIFPQMAYNKAMNTNYQKDTLAAIQDYQVNTPYPAIENGQLIQPSYEPKAIQELFELNYGRMNATLGVELPFTNFNIQTTIPLGYSDPVTENLVDGTTQFWKITHNGVDTHPVHFHLYDLQIMNRVGWDGMIHPNRSNDYGWRETVQMNPLEDIIIAFRPISPRLPFTLTNSLRSPSVTQPANATLSVTDPLTGNAIAQSNAAIDFGWEYVWHCHILGHEENDFMRSQVLTVATTVPAHPSALLAAKSAPTRVDLSWTDNSTNETGFRVERSPAGAGTWAKVGTTVPNQNNFADYTVVGGTAYDYRVFAYNQAGDSTASNTITITPTAVTPASGVTLVASPAASAPFGTAVTFTATASGASAYQYQFLVDDGTGAVVVQDYSISQLYHFTTYQPVGTYTVSVNVRTSTASAIVSASIPYTIAPLKATGVMLSSNYPSPQNSSRLIVFSAIGLGSVGYQYQFSVDGVIYQTYSPVVTFTLPAAVAGIGGVHAVKVDVVTSLPAAVTPDATTTINYTINAVVPAAPTGIAPSGLGITTNPLVYTFNAVTGATSYDIFLWDITTATGGVVASVSANAAGVPNGTGIGSITQPTALTAGNAYAWYVRGNNSAGAGPWNAFLQFAYGPVPATAPIPVAPVGTITGNQPTYQFNGVADATGYDIFLWNITTATGGVVASATAAQAGVALGTTGLGAIVQPTALAPGSYAFYVRGTNNSGPGPWSVFFTFQVP